MIWLKHAPIESQHHFSRPLVIAACAAYNWSSFWRLLADSSRGGQPMRIFSVAIGAVLTLGSAFCQSQAANVVCLGEAVSSRAISRGHNGQVDSAIGTRGDTCLFAAESSIGRQIKKVCSIRDMNSSDETGPDCRVVAVVSKGIIQRVISVTQAFSVPVSRDDVSLVGVSGNTILDHCSKQSDQDYCLAWMQLAADNGRAMKAIDPELKTCIPQEVDATQLRDVAVDYLRKNAKDRHMAATILVAEAFADAWPCQTDKH
jgi:Rap1a immunity proteins